MATAVGIQIRGLKQCVRSLEKMGVEVKDLKASFRKIADIVSGDARGLVNNDSGLASAIRPANQKNKARVIAGGARAPYAGVLNYGGGVGAGNRGPHNIQPQMFLQKAAASNEARSVQIVETEIRGLIRKLDLN